MTNAMLNEMVLYIENTENLYPQYQSICLNIAKKIISKKYDRDLAVKAFGHLVESGMESYHKDYYSYTNIKWCELLTVAERKEVASELLSSANSLIMEYVNTRKLGVKWCDIINE